jgi:tRNA pseudouridine55 synthase
VTSHDVVQTVRRTLGTRAAGHTGTLDPFATGLLVVLVGRATRLARFVEGQLKTYLATARLGIRTDTDDLTGRVIGRSDTGGQLDPADVAEALAEFVGTSLQRPPDFSAKHVGGERSYHKARRGEAVQLEPVSVTVAGLEVLECKPPLVTFRAEVSAGTYIRGIARDLGERLGVGAHLTSLRREAIGSLRVEDSTSLADLSAGVVVPAAFVLGNMASVELNTDMRVAVSHGRAVPDSRAAERGSETDVALLADGELVAVARAEDGFLRPTVVLTTG